MSISRRDALALILLTLSPSEAAALVAILRSVETDSSTGKGYTSGGKSDATSGSSHLATRAYGPYAVHSSFLRSDWATMLPARERRGCGYGQNDYLTLDYETERGPRHGIDTNNDKTYGGTATNFQSRVERQVEQRINEQAMMCKEVASVEKSDQALARLKKGKQELKTLEILLKQGGKAGKMAAKYIAPLRGGLTAAEHFVKMNKLRQEYEADNLDYRWMDIPVEHMRRTVFAPTRKTIGFLYEVGDDVSEHVGRSMAMPAERAVREWMAMPSGPVSWY